MSVTHAAGFRAAGVAAGIKPDGRDVAVVAADGPSIAAGVFTRNAAAAAPVVVSRRHLASGADTRAVIINSGCANAATGIRGMENAETMASVTAQLLGVAEAEVLVCSTGTIGPHLPMDELTSGIADAVRSTSDDAGSAHDAADAIRTTDSVTKEATTDRDGWSIGGMAKGAGMVRPDMATMLALLTTDADVAADVLQRSLIAAVDASFNALNIDGCESTNDSVIVLASGASGVKPDEEEFAAAVTQVCRDLTLQMARDAEGASRVVTIEVDGAESDLAARQLGRRVADSALVRSSFYGGDVNWGRILGALGTDRGLDVQQVAIGYQGTTVFHAGTPTDYDEDALMAACEHGDISVSVGVGSGPGTATVVTTDLTPEYVVFNGERS